MKEADAGIYRRIGDRLRQNPNLLMQSSSKAIDLVVSGKYVMIDVESFFLFCSQD